MKQFLEKEFSSHFKFEHTFLDEFNEKEEKIFSSLHLDQAYLNSLHPKRRKEYIAGRYTLKKLLKDQYKVEEIVFPNKNFSLCHSRKLVLSLQWNSPKIIAGIGIDAESTERANFSERKLAFFLSPTELKQKQHERHDARLKLWCIKEALYKATPDNDSTRLKDYSLSDFKKLDRGFAHCHKVPELRFSYETKVYLKNIIAVATSEKI